MYKAERGGGRSKLGWIRGKGFDMRERVMSAPGLRRSLAEQCTSLFLVSGFLGLLVLGDEFLPVVGMQLVELHR